MRCRLEAIGVRALAALPPRAKRVLAGPPVRRDGLELDLDAQLVVRLNALRPRPPVERRSPARARADLRRSARLVAGPATPVASVRELVLAGAAGPLRARLYAPATAAPEPGPLLVFFHGGGWLSGDLDTHDALCRALARAAGLPVLSVHYRLAPEHPYPAAARDALAAWRDVIARARELGADPQRIAVGGDSAGGHLAALVAQDAAAACTPAPAFQMLAYPATDLVVDHPSEAIFAEGFLLTKRNMDHYEASFVPDRADRRAASPLWREPLAAVAPALVVTAGFDPLRDQGEAYAARLRDAGVPVVLRRHPGQVHGFLSMLGVVAGARDAVSEIGAALRAALAAR